MITIVIYILVILGLIVNAISVVGLIRFPDIYTRLHAATKSATLGSILLVTGIVVKNIYLDDSIDIIIIIHSTIALFVIIFTNPISAHAIARASYIHGIKPHGLMINELEDKDNKMTKDNL